MWVVAALASAGLFGAKVVFGTPINYCEPRWCNFTWVAELSTGSI
jgi:hypothetical protein